MARSGVLAVLLLAAVLLAASWQVGQGAVTCAQVVSMLRPCIPYATGKGELTAACCTGVKNLNNAASTSADRKTACSCLKQQASSISGIQPGVLSGIPGKCGVSVPYAISPSTDCSK